MKYSKRKKKYAGGGTTPYGAIGQASAIGGELLANDSVTESGRVKDGQYIAGKTLSRVGQGAAMGAVAGPYGALAGGAIGLGVGLFEGITGAKKLWKERDERLAAEEEERQRQEADAAEKARQEAEFKLQEQNNWNQAYYSDPMKNPRGNSGTTMFARMGGRIKPGCYAEGGSVNVSGGKLEYLANNTAVAKGNTHAQGGITLNVMGQPNTEVENNEVISNDRVYSDQIKLPNGKTMADEAKRYAKLKGKMEKKANSNDFRSKNTASRTSQYADMMLDGLFNYQQASKDKSDGYFAKGGRVKYGMGDPIKVQPSEEKYYEGFSPAYSQGMTNAGYMPLDGDQVSNEFLGTLAKDPRFNGSAQKASVPSSTGANSGFNPADTGDMISTGLELVSPFIDNWYNSKLIKQAPQVPEPNYRKAYSVKASPLRTNVDISASLSDINNQYRSYTNDLNQNTSSSAVARSNKLQGYARSLQARNPLYQYKNNLETQLVNQSALNQQSVNSINTKNQQDIDNYNLGLKDSYNYAKYQRSDRLLDAKSANVANLSEDLTQLNRDYRARQLDKEKIQLILAGDETGAGRRRYNRVKGRK